MKRWKLFVAVIATIGWVACGGDKPSSSSSSNNSSAKKEVAEANSSDKGSATSSNRKGKLIFKTYCVACHGADGKLGISDATDLSTSTVGMEERINQITNGKGMMTPYKDILTETQIKDVAEYLDELRVD